METLGIIGGMGPLATVRLMERIVTMTEAHSDQEHVEVIAFNCGTIPDRTAYILDPGKPSPLPKLKSYAKQLEELGASCIGIPCITAHYFYQEIQNHVSIPVINMLEESVRTLQEMKVTKVGIMATSGTLQTKILQDTLARFDVAYDTPDSSTEEIIMSLIYDDVKAGRRASTSKMDAVSDFYHSKGCDCIILGCTELSIVKDELGLSDGYLDVLDVLARLAIVKCNKRLKQ